MDVIGQVINGLHSGGHVLMGVVIREGQQIQVSWWVGKLTSHQNDIRKCKPCRWMPVSMPFWMPMPLQAVLFLRLRFVQNFQQRWWRLTFLPGLPEVPPPFRSGQVATLVEVLRYSHDTHHYTRRKNHSMSSTMASQCVFGTFRPNSESLQSTNFQRFRDLSKPWV